MANLIIISGIIIVIIGLLLKFSPDLKIPVFPGDIFIQKDNFTFYFPIIGSIIISIILTILINIFR